MKYVYPAIFHSEDANLLVDMPDRSDLPGTHTFFDDLQCANGQIQLFRQENAVDIIVD
jgi:hypothetical protein